MILIKIPRILLKPKDVKVRLYTQPALHTKSLEKGYTDVPKYPPIVDISYEAKGKQKREEVYRKIKKLKTVEEKQIGLNMQKYYGYKCALFHEDKVPYNAMPIVQCYTRSHFISIDKLPEAYSETEATAADIVKEIKGSVEEAIAIELDGVINKMILTSLQKPEKQQQEDALTKSIVRQINRIISNNLADKTSHILSAQVDYDPRHEAFWFVGGVDPPKSVIRARKRANWNKRDDINDPYDQAVQYLGKPLLALRSNLPLQPLIPYTETESPSYDVPKVTYHPQTTGYFTEFRHGTNIPGFWMGDPDEFGFLSIHGRGHILDRKSSFGKSDDLEALHCQAMKASFGWLLAQANFQGFTTFNDITYPLVTQTAITNGQLWSLYAYQLNTIVMHNEHMDENPKHNICYGTQPMKLYEAFENGKVVGFNDDVLKMIVQLYLNSPEKREHEMKPYLGKTKQMLADVVNDKMRCWLEDRYKHLVSNRPRHLLHPETYLWEKIYKIQHNTRFFEARRRPFELNQFPFTKRLDEHKPQYIPKVLRPYRRHGRKFERTFYPDA